MFNKNDKKNYHKGANMKSKFLMGILFSLIFSEPSYAMHISEGILPFRWALIWWILALFFLIWGLRGLRNYLNRFPERKPLIGFLGAMVFLFSVLPIPVPIAGTCSHPVGVGFSAILIGFSGSIVIGFVVLLLQALLLAHGGLSSLGANAISMAVIGSLSAFLTYKILTQIRLNLYLSAFIAGVLADWFTYLTTAFQLALALKGEEALFSLFLKIALAFTPTQAPLGLLEGVVTAGIVGVIYKRKPEFLMGRF